MTQNNIYWEKIIEKLVDKNEAGWAAHVLSSNIEILDEILLTIDKELLIKNCLLCYSINLSAQPDLDEILSKFTIKELIDAYKRLKERPLETAGALTWLLEDIDPQFKWSHNL